MAYISSRNMAGIVCRTLDYVDERLVSHGKRVSYIMLKMLQEAGEYDPWLIRDLCLVAMIHDIGAYKTEEIDNLIKFETKNVWDHSVYGYLFLKILSPLGEYAPVILYHHMPYEKLQPLHVRHERFAQILKLADRVDVYTFSEYRGVVTDYLRKTRGKMYSEDVVDLFFQAEKHTDMIFKLDSGIFWEEVLDILDQVPFTLEEIDTYLKMLTYTIDFRSEFTVIHTITTTSISMELGRLFQLTESEIDKIRYGALLHDLGKIGIPVDILESPGRLSPQAMTVMKTHVEITEEILNGEIEATVTNIALRHHEKLDGSGYPRGLSGNELSLPERIVAVADLVSALSGERSYKAVFSKEKITSILSGEMDKGTLCPVVVRMVLDHYDEIMVNAANECKPVIKVYNSMKDSYEKLIRQFRKYDMTGQPFI